MALSIGASSADVVAVEARKAGEINRARGERPQAPRPTPPSPTRPAVVSLTQRRLAGLPQDTRPPPSVDRYDQLLHRRTPPTTPPPAREGEVS